MKRLFSILMLMGLSGALCAGEFDGMPATYGDANTTPGVKIRRARNHAGAPEHIYSGDILLGSYGYGYGLTGFQTNPGVSIRMKASADWTDSAQGTKITFETTPSSATTAVEYVSISDQGYLGIKSLTSALIKATTPTVVGQMVFDTTIQKLVISSGTATSFDWVLSTGGRATNY